MTHRSPLVTLIGLVAAFAIMFGVNLAVSSATPGGEASWDWPTTTLRRCLTMRVTLGSTVLTARRTSTSPRRSFFQLERRRSESSG